MPQLDLQPLLEARLWVARLGESDVHKWWRTDGILGSDGAFVGPRVLPRTHPTARARIAFAVAAHACGERHPDPSAKHLFRLDPETEDGLDALLVERLDAFDFWAEQMGQLEQVAAGADIADTLTAAGVIESEDVQLATGLTLGPDDRSIPVPAGSSATETIRRLAAAFLRSSPGQLAVPYVVER